MTMSIPIDAAGMLRAALLQQSCRYQASCGTCDAAQHNTHSADDLHRGLHAISHQALATMLCVLIDCVVVAALRQN